ncbi:hypothetical protein GCK72_022118 [Caenorhabditis remanei]|uniref:Uncharacterized protein n=1 Tax=Caenorhabditis remanei TaxID=31234 RepID=E3MAF9_CAERE|nr:hypothetical protein GCK72_022118 [Caenorhabditis remanei]EFO96813.1 hypothetical protein CRE_17266 [Caenorhabditis remanei]KAF1745671.1 hypothetical protein GCK72_022118 [Caenorhabditis remanei]
MVNWKTISDCCFIAFSAVVLTNYLIQRTEYMESYVEYKMGLCRTDAERIAQLEKWDANHKFETPPFRSWEAWSTFWMIYREKAYREYRHLFNDDYIPPHLRENKIVLTEGGKFLFFAEP